MELFPVHKSILKIFLMFQNKGSRLPAAHCKRLAVYPKKSKKNPQLCCLSAISCTENAD